MRDERGKIFHLGGGVLEVLFCIEEWWSVRAHGTGQTKHWRGTALFTNNTVPLQCFDFPEPWSPTGGGATCDWGGGSESFIGSYR